MEPGNPDFRKPEMAVMIGRFVDGDDDALRVLWCHFRADAVAEVRRRLRHAGIAPGDFDGDDAANGALLRIHRARDRGKLAWVKSGVDFRKLLSVLRSGT